MKKLFKKIKSKKGETLVEVLVGILIIAFAAALFAGMYSATGNINMIAREQDAALYSAVADLEQKKEDSSAKKEGGNVQITDEGGNNIGSVEVDVWSEDGMTSYKKAG